MPSSGSDQTRFGSGEHLLVKAGRVSARVAAYSKAYKQKLQMRVKQQGSGQHRVDPRHFQRKGGLGETQVFGLCSCLSETDRSSILTGRKVHNGSREVDFHERVGTPLHISAAQFASFNPRECLTGAHCLCERSYTRGDVLGVLSENRNTLFVSEIQTLVEIFLAC